MSCRNPSQVPLMHLLIDILAPMALLAMAVLTVVLIALRS